MHASDDELLFEDRHIHNRLTTRTDTKDCRPGYASAVGNGTRTCRTATATRTSARPHLPAEALARAHFAL
jgi:hypothetical protein